MAKKKTDTLYLIALTNMIIAFCSTFTRRFTKRVYQKTTGNKKLATLDWASINMGSAAINTPLRRVIRKTVKKLNWSVKAITGSIGKIIRRLKNWVVFFLRFFRFFLFKFHKMKTVKTNQIYYE